MNIQWYPGHMAKAKRLLVQQLSRVDLVIELCDARMPFSSRNPDLEYLTKSKNKVLILNKADLASPAGNAQWLEFFKQDGLKATTYDAKHGKTDKIFKLIEQNTKETVQRAAARGIKKTVRAMIVGVPNVGKSTLINKLHGGAITKVGDRPGVTRANQWVKVTPYLELLDTPGLLWPRFDDKLAAVRLAYIGTIKDEVVDKETLAETLLQDLMEMIPQKVKERYKLTPEILEQEQFLLSAACIGRGWLAKGGVADMDRGSTIILDEFRGGKLGLITLEKPKKSIEETMPVLRIRERE
ncbi:MAG: ribosome biogenesis GTPase YlqF [Clostridiales bacterium]|nr:ribosome biogenesis GTPase YlqF [Clostridiales bacterium]